MENLIQGLSIIHEKCPEATVEAECGYIQVDLMNEGIDNHSWNILIDKLNWHAYTDGFRYYL